MEKLRVWLFNFSEISVCLLKLYLNVNTLVWWYIFNIITAKIRSRCNFLSSQLSNQISMILYWNKKQTLRLLVQFSNLFMQCFLLHSVIQWTEYFRYSRNFFDVDDDFHSFSIKIINILSEYKHIDIYIYRDTQQLIRRRWRHLYLFQFQSVVINIRQFLRHVRSVKFIA